MAILRAKVTDILADILRFAVRGAILIDGIAIAMASVYITAKIAWFTVRFLDRTLFSAPW